MTNNDKHKTIALQHSRDNCSTQGNHKQINYASISDISNEVRFLLLKPVSATQDV